MSGSGPGSAFRQDLPPPGGYRPIPFERIPAKQLLKSRTLLAVFVGVTWGSSYLYLLNARKTNRLKMEMRGARHALSPMFQAEMDRAYLTQIRKNRDEENRLMKDVPGWITGTYYGSPVFKSRDPEEWHDMSSTELFCHADPWYHRHHMQYHKWM